MSSAKQARTSNGSGRGQRAAAAGAGAAAGKNGTDAAAGGTGTSTAAGGNGTGSHGGSGRPARTGAAGPRGPAAKPGAAGTRAPAAKTGQARPGKPAQSQTRKARDRARARELAEQRANAAPAAIGPPLWLQLTTFVLSIAGLGVSVYMTIEHFTGNATLACSTNSVVNCEAVTTSPESMVFGVFPVAVLGLAFFVVMVAITSPWAWRSARREIALVRLGSVIVGVGFIIYLIYVELFQVGFICLECTSVHVITFLLFALIALSAAVWGLIPRDVRQPREA
jgi:uncharacterized membrane protein